MKKLLIALVVSLMVAATGFIPSIIVSRTARYSICQAVPQQYQQSVKCSGRLYPAMECAIVTSGVYRIAERYHDVGEYVQSGEILARVESIAGESFYVAEKRPQEENSDVLNELMRQYGGAEVSEISNGLSEAKGLLEAIAAREGEQFVLAPIDGVLTQGIPMPGTAVQTGEIFCVLSDTGSWIAKLQLPERLAGEVSVGNPVKITGETAGAGGIWGEISQIGREVKSVFSGTGYDSVVEVTVQISTQHPCSLSGTAVQAQIFTEEARTVLLLPYEAVYQDQENREYIIAATSQGLEKFYVETGVELAGGIEIREGLPVCGGFVRSMDLTEPPELYILEREEG